MHLKLILAALLVSVLLIDQAHGWRRFRIRVRTKRLGRTLRRFRGRKILKKIGRGVKKIGKHYLKTLVSPYGKWLKPFGKFGKIRNLAKGVGRFMKSSLGYLVKTNKNIFGIIRKNEELLKRIIKEGRCIPRRRKGDAAIPKEMLDGPNNEYMSVDPEFLIEAYNEDTAGYPEMTEDEWNEMVNDMQRVEDMVKDQNLQLADLTYLLDDDDKAEPKVADAEEDGPESDNELYDLELMDLDEE